MNDPKLWIELATIAFALIGGWFTMRSKVESAHAKAVEAAEAAADLQDRVDRMDRDLAALKRDSEHHSKALDTGLGRIEGSISALHLRLDRALEARQP